MGVDAAVERREVAAEYAADEVFPAPAIPCSSTPVRPLCGASAVLARAIAAARPTNRTGSGGRYAVGVSSGFNRGVPAGTGSTSPAARAPNSPGVATATPDAPFSARATATSTG